MTANSIASCFKSYFIWLVRLLFYLNSPNFIYLQFILNARPIVLILAIVFIAFSVFILA